MNMNDIPHEDTLDSTIDLLREGYYFINNRVEKFQSDLFETRLMGQKAICMRGKEAAELFYDEDKFQRKWAVPNRIQETLVGKNSVQTLDGMPHLIRKHLHMSLMTPVHQKRLKELILSYWKIAQNQWESKDNIVLFDEAKIVLCKAACQWAGVPLSKKEEVERAEDFIAMIYSFGTVGPEHWKGRLARNRVEEWIVGIIENVRSGNLEANQDGALYKMAFSKIPDKHGKPVDTKTAAVELMNVLRPIVAIATYITFAALALHEHEGQKKKLRHGNSEDMERFIHEVRRYYPFGPFVGARVRKTFHWKDYAFKKGTLVFLDIYGTNHDPRIWSNPNQFNPDRFKGWDGNLFEFIPHGGGDPAKGHRCPGEGITVEVMKATLEFLIKNIEYEVPNQDLTYSMDKIPTLPKSRFVITNVRNLA